MKFGADNHDPPPRLNPLWYLGLLPNSSTSDYLPVTMLCFVASGKHKPVYSVILNMFAF